MNTRAATLFFWGFLIGTATLASERHRTEVGTAADSKGDAPQVQALLGNDQCDASVPREHDLVAMN